MEKTTEDLHLAYKNETGKDPTYPFNMPEPKYVEWLESKLLDKLK